jgi:hypothetical protein
MYDLGFVTSRSRPRVSNDNPYSESLFRTVKCHPRWPSEGFKSLDEARQWIKEFFIGTKMSIAIAGSSLWCHASDMEARMLRY